MGLFDKIKDFFRGNKGTGEDDSKYNADAIQTTFNEDGLDVLVEDGTVENATNADEKVNENENAPEGIGTDGFTMRTWKPYDNKNYFTESWGGWNTCIQGYPTDSQANVLSNCVGLNVRSL